jgi:hypothetical protein
MKTRKFADGGDALEEANKGEDLAAELRGENTLVAMRDAAAKPKPKPKRQPVVRKNTRDGEAGNTRGSPSYDSTGKPSNAGPDTYGSGVNFGSRNTRTGATAKMMQPSYPSKESMMTRRTQYEKAQDESAPSTFRKGGAVKKYAAGGSVSSRADGIAQRGKTRGKMC